MYYNYHLIIKKKIKNNELKFVEIVENYNNIKPAMLLHLKDSKIMAIREYRFNEYFELLSEMNFTNIVFKTDFKI